MTDSPADQLRAAATLLRDRATGAIHDDRRTWATGHTLGSRSPVVLDDPEQPSVLIETYAARLEQVNRYLALLGPATGLALADWLDRAAEHAKAQYLCCDNGEHQCLDVAAPALAVARQLLRITP